MLNKIAANPVKTALIAATALVGLGVLNASWYSTQDGYSYYVQDKLRGTASAKFSAGVHFKVPFFTTVYPYKQFVTIDNTQADGEFTRNLNPIPVVFADTYSAEIPLTYRFRLPTDEQAFMRLHQDFRGFNNLVDALLVQTAKDIAVVTATQYTGEEFFQGGMNEYKARLEDQLAKGAFVTKRERVAIKEAGYAAVSSDNKSANAEEEKTRIVNKNVVQVGPDGQPMRLENPLAPYGIGVSQVTISTAFPDTELNALLLNKRQSVGEKISAQQEIETNRVKAEAAAQQREIEKQVAIQDAQKERELAIIAQKKEVDVEAQRAQKELVQKQKEVDVAVLEKKKELDIAVANKDIQEANANAAEAEARAIREVGLAEADVDRAKLAAKQSAKDIYLAEVNRDIAKVMYPALQGVVIDMPDYYAGGTDGAAAPTSLDVFTTLGVVKQLQESVNAKTSE